MTESLPLFTNDWQKLPGHLNFLLTFLMPRWRDKHTTNIDWFDEVGDTAVDKNYNPRELMYQDHLRKMAVIFKGVSSKKS